MVSGLLSARCAGYSELPQAADRARHGSIGVKIATKKIITGPAVSSKLSACSTSCSFTTSICLSSSNCQNAQASGTRQFDLPFV